MLLPALSLPSSHLGSLVYSLLLTPTQSLGAFLHNSQFTASMEHSCAPAWGQREHGLCTRVTCKHPVIHPVRLSLSLSLSLLSDREESM